MKFLITCDNCDYQFLTTGESRQTVQCQCPHCGGTMKMKLPDAPVASKPTSDKSTSDKPTRKAGGPLPEKPRRRTGCGIAVGLFLGLFILVLAGMVVYSLTSREQTRRIEDPFEHVYDDSTRYDDSFDPLPAEEPDTIEQHIDTHEETEASDSTIVSEPSSEHSETSDISDKSENSEKSDKSEPPEKSDKPEQPTN